MNNSLISMHDILGTGKLAEVTKDWWIHHKEPEQLQKILEVFSSYGINLSQLKLSYEGAGVKLKIEGNQETVLPDELREQIDSLIKLSVEDQLCRFIKHKLNLKSILEYAKHDFSDKESVSNEPIDIDWSARFEHYARDINGEYMQRVWAKILAGEVKQPGSFSLRCLDLLRNLSKEEAEKFTKICHFLVCNPLKTIYFLFYHEKFFKKEHIDFNELLYFEELGLIKNKYGIIRDIFNTDRQAHIIYANRKLIEWDGKTFKAGPVLQSFHTMVLTRLGMEVLKLISPTEPRDDYIRLIYKTLSKYSPKTIFFISDIVGSFTEASEIFSENKVSLNELYENKVT